MAIGTEPVHDEGTSSETEITLVDVDVHPMMPPAALMPRLSDPWRKHFAAFGPQVAGGLAWYHRARNGGFRADAWWPENGFLPGGELEPVQKQLLDEYDIDYAILTPMQQMLWAGEHPELAAELCRAMNDWQRDEWLDREPRLLGSICPPHEHPDLAVKEIERLAGDPRFVQVLLPTTAAQEFGDRKYWPMLRAAAEAGLPVALHTGGNEIHRGTGWPSFYLEMHVWNGNTMALQIASLICSGVFAEIPDLQIMSVECGISWAAAFAWTLDGTWNTFSEHMTTGLRTAPAELLREHFWFSTQPIEEPENPEHLNFAYEALGMMDRILFSTDYPHWDFDSPTQALPRSISAEDKQKILAGNACKLYALPGQGRSR